MKILTITGARPQFIKAGVVSKAISEQPGIQQQFVHTGQHFDANMSEIFFEQLTLPRPDYQLNINSGNHGAMTGRMLAALEEVLLDEQPDRVLVFGDTNSTLAGALAAAKLHIPVAHVEAGLRSFNMRMPEEINRILTDQLSDVLYCPTQVAMENLANEGFARKPVQTLCVGDVMQDSAILFAEFAAPPQNFEADEGFVLATLHRAENTDDSARLSAIVDAINELHRTTAEVVMPLHPRTRKAIRDLGLKLDARVLEPVGYLEMLWLLRRCGLVLTDSGGLQKESYFYGKFCVTMRDQTEWVELIDAGANLLTGANRADIISAVSDNIGRAIDDDDQIYGGGEASRRIATHLAEIL